MAFKILLSVLLFVPTSGKPIKEHMINYISFVNSMQLLCHHIQLKEKGLIALYTLYAT
jgi:hypothetical protein